MKFLFDIDDTLSQTSQPWEDLSRQYLIKKGYKRIEGAEPSRKIEDCFEMTKQQKGLYIEQAKTLRLVRKVKVESIQY